MLRLLNIQEKLPSSDFQQCLRRFEFLRPVSQCLSLIFLDIIIIIIYKSIHDVLLVISAMQNVMNVTCFLCVCVLCVWFWGGVFFFWGGGGGGGGGGGVKAFSPLRSD